MNLPIGSAQQSKGLDSMDEQLPLLTTLCLEETPLPTFLLAQLSSTMGWKLSLHNLWATDHPRDQSDPLKTSKLRDTMTSMMAQPPDMS